MNGRFTKMVYRSADDMLFGHSKKPVSYGCGIVVGVGRVIPEIGYTPKEGIDRTPARMRKEYVDYISRDIVDRAVSLGFPDVQLETEWTQTLMSDAETVRSVVAGQKSLTEDCNKKYGINLAVRHTIPDTRKTSRGLRKGMDGVNAGPERLFECCETACETGTDVITPVTVGGTEIAEYAVARSDITAYLFGIGYLGSIDMEYVWSNVAEICRKRGAISAGDTVTVGSITDPLTAELVPDKELRPVFTAVAKCIAAARSLVAQEHGAQGPQSGRGGEGTVCKAVSGMPSAQEGKNSQCAKAVTGGNLTAQCADLWSNGTVMYHPEFGGSSVQCWLGPLGYECSLMNTATALGQNRVLRDVYAASGRTKSPDAFVTSYENAWEVGNAIAQNGENYYLRAKAAALKGAEILQKGDEDRTMTLTRRQKEFLDRMRKELLSLPDDENAFFEQCCSKYQDKVQDFVPKSYGF